MEPAEHILTNTNVGYLVIRDSHPSLFTCATGQGQGLQVALQRSMFGNGNMALC